MKNTISVLFLSSILTLNAFAQGIDNDNFSVTHGPWLQNLNTSGVTIIWTTNKPAIPGIVLTTAGGSSRLIRNSHYGNVDGGGTLHKVRIEGLLPGTSYSYALNSVQVLKYQAYKVYYGDTIRGKQVTFFTPPVTSEKVAFTVVNDVHELSGKFGLYLRHNDITAQDLYICNGDMVNWLQDPAQLFPGFLDTAVTFFASAKPFYYVRGNHETRGYATRELRDYFEYKDDRFYYSFDRGPVHFVVLDCGEDKPDNSKEYYGLADFDEYRQQELEWLKEEVRSDAFTRAKYRIVIIHMPVLKAEKQNHAMTWLAANFGPVLRDAGISFMMSAHTHRNTYYEKEKTGLGYPLLVNSNNTFVEVIADTKGIKAVVKDVKGDKIAEYLIK